MASVREMTGHDKRQGTDQDHGKGPREQCQRKRLHQHCHAETDQCGRHCLAVTAAQIMSLWQNGLSFHLRTAPKVMPRSRCLRNTTVKMRIGTTKSVVAAATAGQS